jgi:hypothetical protein
MLKRSTTGVASWASAAAFYATHMDENKNEDKNDFNNDVDGVANFDPATDSPLAIISLTLPKSWVLEGKRRYEDMARWCRKHKNTVLYQYEFKTNAIKLYFNTKELYIEFVKTFPEVLKNEDAY